MYVPTTGVRARVRAELTREIADVARHHLASDGAAALSLRAVARELGMASSAVYRYFPSRDDLITTLIVDAYDALGSAAEAAEARPPRDDLRGRWLAACRAVRAWAVAHPHEYALVYGSPVPGYAAPPATVGPASRVGLVLCRVVADALAAGVTDPGDAVDVLTPGLAANLDLPETTLTVRAVGAWTALFGLVNFELFGHTHNVVADHDRYFTQSANHLADTLGLPEGTAR